MEYDAAMQKLPINIVAEWDPDVSVWVATSDDIAGFVMEDATIERLVSRIPGVLEDVGVLPLSVLEGMNAHIARVSQGVPGTALADVYQHFIGHGAMADLADRWYWRRSLVEPNVVGAHEIRRVWREALDTADADFRA